MRLWVSSWEIQGSVPKWRWRRWWMMMKTKGTNRTLNYYSLPKRKKYWKGEERDETLRGITSNFSEAMSHLFCCWTAILPVDGMLHREVGDPPILSDWLVLPCHLFSLLFEKENISYYILSSFTCCHLQGRCTSHFNCSSTVGHRWGFHFSKKFYMHVYISYIYVQYVFTW